MATIQLVLEYKMKKDIINKLNSLNFVDGVNLQNHSILNNETTFWQHILDNASASKNNSYIVYEIAPEREKIFGDGEGVVAKLNCSLNLYTINSPESKETYDLRTALEQEFSSNLWEIEFNLYEYDKDTRLNHYSYTISSIYGSD